MARILIPLPADDFDPTESAVPWLKLRQAGHSASFATPYGIRAEADPIMLTGQGLGWLKGLLRANSHGRDAYAAMAASAEFAKPLAWREIRHGDFDALLLPGGHAPGMRRYLESSELQACVAEFFAAGKPVAAICHGVPLAACTKDASGRSVLYGRKTTALTKTLELSAWALTALWMGGYYRTYAKVLQDEVTAVLKSPDDFLTGPAALKRDSPTDLSPGFVVKDGKAHVQPVDVSRTFQGISVVATGLSGGEDVIVDGQLLLSEGTPVAPRAPKAGA